MKTVFLRELVLAFRRITSYIVIGVSALVTAIFFITSNLAFTHYTIASTISFAQLVSAAAIPIFAFLVFLPSKKADTDAFYDMLPLKNSAIFFGKYLSALTLFAVSIAPLLFYPIIAGAFGAVDLGQCYLLILLYVMSEAAFLAVCCTVCIALRKLARAVPLALSYVLGVVILFAAIANVVIPVKPVVSLVLFALTFFLAVVVIFLITRKIILSAAVLAVLETALFVMYFSLPELFVCGFERFLDSLAIFDRLSAFTVGLFDVSAMVFYVCAVVLLLFFAYRAFVRKRSTPSQIRAYHSSLASIVSVVLIVAVALGNVALYFLPRRAILSDMSVTHRNTVGEKAQRFLATVDKPVTIYLLEPTGAADYELYLENVAACSPHISIEKVYYSNTPEFYTDRGISFDYANSLYIEGEERGDYISYPDLFTYTNELLGLTDMSASDYQYYYSMFASNSSYAEYLTVLTYNTVENYNADAMICSAVEYAAKDIIPTSYYLTGHGELPLDAADGAFANLGFVSLKIENGVPADAASILINAPTTDISASEKQALLDFLERGGEITFVTNTANLAMPNLMAVLAEYGLSATPDIVTVPKATEDSQSEDQSQDGERTSEFTPIMNTQSDILYLFAGQEYAFTLKDTNNISGDSKAKPALIITPLLVVRDGETLYTVACSAETAAGARIAWFTGAESYNTTKSIARFCPISASTWTIIRYESDVDNVPSVIYEPLGTPVTAKSAVVVAVILVTLPLAFVVYGCVICARRRKIKAA